MREDHVGRPCGALRRTPGRAAAAAAFRLAPDEALAAQNEPVLIDEWQEVPEILAAVKRAVDANHRPGKFVLTGSVRATLEATTWPATGRVVPLAMVGLAVAELHGVGQDLLSRLADPARLTAAPRVHAQHWTVSDYVEQALAGMYPQLQTGSAGDARLGWMPTSTNWSFAMPLPLGRSVRRSDCGPCFGPWP